jgi:hypothetical protein
MKTSHLHPTQAWSQDARRLQAQSSAQIRLAAMAAHMRRDPVAARRAALIDLLGDGRPHSREEIWENVRARLDADCWGQTPREALARDLRVLREGGLRIAYSRRPGAVGYYLQYPALERPPPTRYEAISWTLVEEIRKLSPAEKNERAFAAAAFALGQKRQLLAAAHPEWPADKVARAAQAQVFGVKPPTGEESDVGL